MEVTFANLMQALDEVYALYDAMDMDPMEDVEAVTDLLNNILGSDYTSKNLKEKLPREPQEPWFSISNHAVEAYQNIYSRV